MIANVIDPDFMVALTGASSTLLLGPRQIRSFDEGGQRNSRICTVPIAIDRLHECCSAQLDIRNIAKVFGAPQMLGGVVELAGAVLFWSSLVVSDVPGAVVFVQKAILITEICFHSHSIRGLGPLAIRRGKLHAI